MVALFGMATAQVGLDMPQSLRLIGLRTGT